jgi:hypothetical protein
MRKTLVIIMAVSFILTIITGIGESGPQHSGPAVAHIIITIVFIASVLAHLCLNRRACLRYLGVTNKPASSSG